VELVTKEDLQAFRTLMLNDIKTLLAEHRIGQFKSEMQGYRTKDVHKILGCCVNKLVSLRTARKIRWKKVGGTIYYNEEDVRKLVEEGFK